MNARTLVRLLAHAGDSPAVEILPGCHRQTLVYGPGMMVCLFSLREGTLFEPHRHVHEQAGYVISGALELTVDGRTVVVRAGSSYYFLSGQLHGARALEDTTVLDLFSPPREDYLPPAQT